MTPRQTTPVVKRVPDYLIDQVRELLRAGVERNTIAGRLQVSPAKVQYAINQIKGRS